MGRVVAKLSMKPRCERSIKPYKKNDLVLTLFPACGGDYKGAKLKADGASIPTYPETGGNKPPALSPEEEDRRRWDVLYKDPFYEMRLLGLRPSLGRGSFDASAKKLETRVQSLTSDDELQSKLEDFKFGQVFRQAYAIVTGPESKPFTRLMDTASSNLDEDYKVIARTIVAVATNLRKQRDIVPYLLAPQYRDPAVKAIQYALSKREVSEGGANWVKQQFEGAIFNIGAYFGTNQAVRKRGALMDSTYPLAGDILVYQAKGEGLREFIKSEIEDPKVEPPVGSDCP